MNTIVKYMNAGIKLLTDSDYRFLFWADRGKYNHLCDEEYLIKRYKATMGKELNLQHPSTFNEKLQWLKLYDRNPLYTDLVDKIEVKKHVANKIGEEYIIPTLGVWNAPEEIDFDSLPEQFVLKCNHNSGLGMCICKDKSKLNISKVRKALRKGLQEDKYYIGREWPYKNVKRRILAEKYIEDKSGVLDDYKFFCFNGIADNVMIVTDRATPVSKFYHFSKDWHLLKYNRRGRSLPDDYTMFKPKNMSKMFQLAEELSVGFPEVRVDLYNVNGKIYFGEYTFFNESGFESGFDYQSDKHLGDLIILPHTNLTNP